VRQPSVAATVSKLDRPILLLVAHHQDETVTAQDLEFFLGYDCDVFPPASDDTDVDSLQQQEVIQRLFLLRDSIVYQRIIMWNQHR
jgi:hypothetical protein